LPFTANYNLQTIAFYAVIRFVKREKRKYPACSGKSKQQQNLKRAYNLPPKKPFSVLAIHYLSVHLN
jgi:hypothetical protein